MVHRCGEKITFDRMRAPLDCTARARDSGRMATETEPLDLLMRLLKLGSLINWPMNQEVCESAGLSQVEIKVLMALAGEGPLAGHELVRIMGLQAMNVSRAIAALTARGLVAPAPDPENRRRKPVALTEAGRDAHAALQPALERVAQALLGQLGARPSASFAATADKIILAMRRWTPG